MLQHVSSPAPSSHSLWIAEGYRPLLAAHGLASLDALFAYRAGERMDKPGLASWRQRWRMTLKDGDRLHVFYMKRFVHLPRGAWRETQRMGHEARTLAGNEFQWIHRLSGDGIPCAEPVALGEEARRGREVRSVLVTAAAPGRSLEAWVRRWTLAERQTVQSLIRSTAALVARLHACGYAHRDLYLSHIFFDAAQPEESALRLIDLQRVIRPTWRFSRWRVKDLAALHYSSPPGFASRADRLRWLRYYLNTARLGSDGKKLAYRVIGKTQQIARRDKTRLVQPGAT